MASISASLRASTGLDFQLPANCGSFLTILGVGCMGTLAGVKVPKLALAAVETKTIGAGLLSIPLDRLERGFGVSTEVAGFAGAGEGVFVVIGLMACMGDRGLLDVGLEATLACGATTSNGLAFFVNLGGTAFDLAGASLVLALAGTGCATFFGTGAVDF